MWPQDIDSLHIINKYWFYITNSYVFFLIVLWLCVLVIMLRSVFDMVV